MPSSVCVLNLLPVGPEAGASATSAGLRFTAVSCDSSGSRVGFATSDGALFVLNVARKQHARVTDGRLSTPATSLLFSDAAPALVYAAVGDCVQCYNLSTGGLEQTIVGHKKPVHSLGQSFEGSQLLTASRDCGLLWSAAAGAKLTRLRSLSAATGVAAALFVPAAQQLVLAFGDDSVMVYHSRTFAVVARLRLSEGEAGARLRLLASSIDGTFLVAASESGCLYCWDVPEERLVRVIDLPSPAIAIGVVSAGLVAAQDARAAAASGIPPPAAHEKDEFGQRAPHVVVLGRDGCLLCLELPASGCNVRVELPGPIDAFSLSADAKFLAVGGREGRLSVYDLPLLRLEQSLLVEGGEGEEGEGQVPSSSSAVYGGGSEGPSAGTSSIGGGGPAGWRQASSGAAAQPAGPLSSSSSSSAQQQLRQHLDATAAGTPPVHPPRAGSSSSSSASSAASNVAPSSIGAGGRYGLRRHRRTAVEVPFATPTRFVLPRRLESTIADDAAVAVASRGSSAPRTTPHLPASLPISLLALQASSPPPVSSSSAVASTGLSPVFAVAAVSNPSPVGHFSPGHSPPASTWAAAGSSAAGGLAGVAASGSINGSGRDAFTADGGSGGSSFAPTGGLGVWDTVAAAPGGLPAAGSPVGRPLAMATQQQPIAPLHPRVPAPAEAVEGRQEARAYTTPSAALPGGLFNHTTPPSAQSPHGGVMGHDAAPTAGVASDTGRSSDLLPLGDDHPPAHRRHADNDNTGRPGGIVHSTAPTSGPPSIAPPLSHRDNTLIDREAPSSASSLPAAAPAPGSLLPPPFQSALGSTPPLASLLLTQQQVPGEPDTRGSSATAAAAAIHARIRTLLRTNGPLPATYRPVAWRVALRLPCSARAARDLFALGPHPSWAHLSYGPSESAPTAALRALCSALTHWSPVFGELAFLPSLVRPFLQLSLQQATAAAGGASPSAAPDGAAGPTTAPGLAATAPDLMVPLETVIGVLSNWGRHWVECLPHPPVPLLSRLHITLAYWDVGLATALEAAGASPVVYAWPLLRSAFSEALAPGDWAALWDHLIVNSHDPSLSVYAVVAVLRYVRGTLLAVCTANGAGPLPPAAAATGNSTTTSISSSSRQAPGSPTERREAQMLLPSTGAPLGAGPPATPAATLPQDAAVADICAFLRRPLPLNISGVLELMYDMRQRTPAWAHPLPIGDRGVRGGGSAAAASGGANTSMFGALTASLPPLTSTEAPPLLPPGAGHPNGPLMGACDSGPLFQLPQDAYPPFLRFPPDVVKAQAATRARIAAEELALREKRALAAALTQRAAALATEEAVFRLERRLGAEAAERLETREAGEEEARASGARAQEEALLRSRLQALTLMADTTRGAVEGARALRVTDLARGAAAAARGAQARARAHALAVTREAVGRLEEETVASISSMHAQRSSVLLQLGLGGGGGGDVTQDEKGVEGEGEGEGEGVEQSLDTMRLLFPPAHGSSSASSAVPRVPASGTPPYPPTAPGDPDLARLQRIVELAQAEMGAISAARRAAEVAVGAQGRRRLSAASAGSRHASAVAYAAGSELQALLGGGGAVQLLQQQEVVGLQASSSGGGGGVGDGPPRQPQPSQQQQRLPDSVTGEPSQQQQLLPQQQQHGQQQPQPQHAHHPSSASSLPSGPVSVIGSVLTPRTIDSGGIAIQLGDDQHLEDAAAETESWIPASASAPAPAGRNGSPAAAAPAAAASPAALQQQGGSRVHSSPALHTAKTPVHSPIGSGSAPHISSGSEEMRTPGAATANAPTAQVASEHSTRLTPAAASPELLPAAAVAPAATLAPVTPETKAVSAGAAAPSSSPPSAAAVSAATSPPPPQQQQHSPAAAAMSPQQPGPSHSTVGAPQQYSPAAVAGTPRQQGRSPAAVAVTPQQQGLSPAVSPLRQRVRSAAAAELRSRGYGYYSAAAENSPNSPIDGGGGSSPSPYSPVIGSPVTGSPVTGSPVTGSPVTGSPYQGSSYQVSPAVIVATPAAAAALVPSPHFASPSDAVAATATDTAAAAAAAATPSPRSRSAPYSPTSATPAPRGPPAPSAPASGSYASPAGVAPAPSDAPLTIGSAAPASASPRPILGAAAAAMVSPPGAVATPPAPSPGVRHSASASAGPSGRAATPAHDSPAASSHLLQQQQQQPPGELDTGFGGSPQPQLLPSNCARETAPTIRNPAAGSPYSPSPHAAFSGTGLQLPALDYGPSGSTSSSAVGAERVGPTPARMSESRGYGSPGVAAPASPHPLRELQQLYRALSGSSPTSPLRRASSPLVAAAVVVAASGSSGSSGGPRSGGGAFPSGGAAASPKTTGGVATAAAAGAATETVHFSDRGTGSPRVPASVPDLSPRQRFATHSDGSDGGGSAEGELGEGGAGERDLHHPAEAPLGAAQQPSAPVAPALLRLHHLEQQQQPPPSRRLALSPSPTAPTPATAAVAALAVATRTPGPTGSFGPLTPGLSPSMYYAASPYRSSTAHSSGSSATPGAGTPGLRQGAIAPQNVLPSTPGASLSSSSSSSVQVMMMAGSGALGGLRSGPGELANASYFKGFLLPSAASGGAPVVGAALPHPAAGQISVKRAASMPPPFAGGTGALGAGGRASMMTQSAGSPSMVAVSTSRGGGAGEEHYSYGDGVSSTESPHHPHAPMRRHAAPELQHSHEEEESTFTAPLPVPSASGPPALQWQELTRTGSDEARGGGSSGNHTRSGGPATHAGLPAAASPPTRAAPITTLAGRYAARVAAALASGSPSAPSSAGDISGPFSPLFSPGGPGSPLPTPSAASRPPLDSGASASSSRGAGPVGQAPGPVPAPRYTLEQAAAVLRREMYSATARRTAAVLGGSSSSSPMGQGVDSPGSSASSSSAHQLPRRHYGAAAPASGAGLLASPSAPTAPLLGPSPRSGAPVGGAVLPLGARPVPRRFSSDATTAPPPHLGAAAAKAQSSAPAVATAAAAHLLSQRPSIGTSAVAVASPPALAPRGGLNPLSRYGGNGEGTAPQPTALAPPPSAPNPVSPLPHARSYPAPTAALDPGAPTAPALNGRTGLLARQQRPDAPLPSSVGGAPVGVSFGAVIEGATMAPTPSAGSRIRALEAQVAAAPPQGYGTPADGGVTATGAAGDDIYDVNAAVSAVTAELLLRSVDASLSLAAARWLRADNVGSNGPSLDAEAIGIARGAAAAARRVPSSAPGAATPQARTMGGDGAPRTSPPGAAAIGAAVETWDAGARTPGGTGYAGMDGAAPRRFQAALAATTAPTHTPAPRGGLPESWTSVERGVLEPELGAGSWGSEEGGHEISGSSPGSELSDRPLGPPRGGKAAAALHEQQHEQQQPLQPHEQPEQQHRQQQRFADSSSSRVDYGAGASEQAGPGGGPHGASSPAAAGASSPAAAAAADGVPDNRADTDAEGEAPDAGAPFSSQWLSLEALPLGGALGTAPGGGPTAPSPIGGSGPSGAPGPGVESTGDQAPAPGEDWLYEEDWEQGDGEEGHDPWGPSDHDEAVAEGLYSASSPAAAAVGGGSQDGDSLDSGRVRHRSLIQQGGSPDSDAAATTHLVRGSGDGTPGEPGHGAGRAGDADSLSGEPVTAFGAVARDEEEAIRLAAQYFGS